MLHVQPSKEDWSKDKTTLAAGGLMDMENELRDAANDFGGRGGELMDDFGGGFSIDLPEISDEASKKG